VACTNERCSAQYPFAWNGAPVLIDETRSLFQIDELLRAEPFHQHASRLGLIVDRLIPRLSGNLASRSNCARLAKLLLERSTTPRVLVLGGSILGLGIDELFNAGIELVETDISTGLRTQIVCDAHSIPFADRSFDGVICQAVLEHVIDPFRVVEEIHRVLRNDGYVYAETPFMQQVHGGAYDFHRFTHLGHSRLFRRFDEVSSGLLAGPGTALAWAYDYFVSAFVTSLSLRRYVRVLTRLTGGWLKYFDRITRKNPGALDAASAIFFLGIRSERTRSDREIVASYSGSNPAPRDR
jgi:SAM-dependent methyltransferase